MSFLCKNFKSFIPCFSSKKSRPPLPHHRRPMSERPCSLLLITLMTHLLQWKSATKCSFCDSWIPLPPKPTSNRNLAGLLKEDGKKANCEKTETYKKFIEIPCILCSATVYSHILVESSGETRHGSIYGLYDII